MNGYFLTIILINILTIGIHIGKHGEPTNGEYNFVSRTIVALIDIALVYLAIKTGF